MSALNGLLTGPTPDSMTGVESMMDDGFGGIAGGFINGGMGGRGYLGGSTGPDPYFTLPQQLVDDLTNAGYIPAGGDDQAALDGIEAAIADGWVAGGTPGTLVPPSLEVVDPAQEDTTSENTTEEDTTATPTGPTAEEATDAIVGVLQGAGVTPNPNNPEDVLMGDGGWLIGGEYDFGEGTWEDVIRGVLPGPIEGGAFEVLGAIKEAGADIGDILSGEQDIADVLSDWGDAAVQQGQEWVDGIKGAIDGAISTGANTIGSIGGWIVDNLPEDVQAGATSYAGSLLEDPSVELPTNIVDEEVTDPNVMEPDSTGPTRNGMSSDGGQIYEENPPELEPPVTTTSSTGVTRNGMGTDGRQITVDNDPGQNPLENPSTTTSIPLATEGADGGGSGGLGKGDPVDSGVMMTLNPQYDMLQRRNISQRSLVASMFGDMI